MNKLTYLLLCLVLGIGLATAQTRKVTGTVISAEELRNSFSKSNACL